MIILILVSTPQSDVRPTEVRQAPRYQAPPPSHGRTRTVEEGTRASGGWGGQTVFIGELDSEGAGGDGWVGVFFFLSIQTLRTDLSPTRLILPSTRGVIYARAGLRSRKG